ncbi:MAG: 6-phosphogluconolactonase [Actinomycetota bacterium]
MYELVVTATAEDAAREAARRVACAIRDARAARGVAHVALAGGGTPRRAYELLAPQLADWRDVHLWFGDERCVPPDDPDSNHRLVRESLLARVEIPADRVHRIRGELPPAQAAAAYADELVRVVPPSPGGVPRLDLALLGVGADGHTASLFPGDPALDAPELCRAVRAPVRPAERVTLGLGVLRAARAALILAAGTGKAPAVAAALRGPDPDVPASLLPSGTTVVLADREAAADAG